MCCCECIKRIYGENITKSNRDQVIRHMKKLDPDVFGWKENDPSVRGKPHRNKKGQESSCVGGGTQS